MRQNRSQTTIVDALSQFKHPHQLESTPLVIATIHANVEAVRTLLALGANPSSANQMQWTPLHFAVSNATAAHVEIARMLLRSPGVQVDACSGLGMTPLHIAARSGHSELITLLLEHNADTQKQCRDNLTPRDHALRSGSAVVARFDLLVAEHARRRDNRMLLCALRRSPDVWIAALPLSVFQHVGAMVCDGEFAYDSDHVSSGTAEGSCGSEFTADEAMTEPRTSTALSSGAPPLSARSSSSSSSSRCRRWSLRRADS